MSLWDSFTGGVGGIADALTGNGKKKTTQTSNVEPASDRELAYLDQINNFVGQGLINEDNNTTGLTSKDNDIDQLFRKQLMQYLTSDQGKVTPEIIQQAKEFVDQTFTNPAQASYDQFARNYEGSQAEQAAQLGRSPLDSSIQQQNFRTLSDVSSNLAAQRGSQIAQRSDLLAYQRPLEQAQNNASLGLQGINEGMQRAGFINDLNQRGFQNRLSLMNMRTGLYNGLTNQRLSAAGKTVTTNAPDAGLLGNFTRIYNGIAPTGPKRGGDTGLGNSGGGGSGDGGAIGLSQLGQGFSSFGAA